MNDKLIKIGDKTYKEAKVIMLPTDNTKEGMLFKGNDGKITQEFRRYPSGMYHLYIITSEEIKEDDYSYNTFNNKVQKVTSENKLWTTANNCLKIIATTDSSLTVEGMVSIYQRKGLTNHYPTSKSLPRPSSDFIKKFCELNGDIKDVLVEYETIDVIGKHPGENWEYHDGEAALVIYKRLKVAPDNTISIIKKSEPKLYTQEEVKSLMLKSAWTFIGFNDEANTEEDIKDWIDQQIN